MPSILDRQIISRAYFDAGNESHLESFRIFLRTGNWGQLQFFAEAPYIDVPMTVLMKFAEYTEGVKRESAAEANDRFAALKLKQMPKSETREEKASKLMQSNKLIDTLLEGLRATT